MKDTEVQDRDETYFSFKLELNDDDLQNNG